MDEPIVVGIDIGTTKICTLVARLEGETDMRILGNGIVPSQGIKKGIVVDITAASDAVASSVEKAQRSSGLEIASAVVSMAGSHVSSMNSRGVVGINGGEIDQNDLDRALEAAQAVAMPHNREVIHVIQRGITVDGQEGIRSPIGFKGYRLEVEAHIITAAAATVENLRRCVESSGVEVSNFVLNPLASAEVVLSQTEREMGVCVLDIGGGTSDLAIYINGDVWHTNVIPVGGNQVTSDIAIGLRIPLDLAEDVKLKHGHAVKTEINQDDFITLKVFGEEAPQQISKRDLAYIIEARVDELFTLVQQEIRRSGYDSMLPAGIVLTGGTSLLPGIRTVASRVLNMPVRLAKPENLVGLVDKLQSPAYSTSFGLLKWAEMFNMAAETGKSTKGGAKKGDNHTWEKVKKILDRFKV